MRRDWSWSDGVELLRGLLCEAAVRSNRIPRTWTFLGNSGGVNVGGGC